MTIEKSSIAIYGNCAQHLLFPMAIIFLNYNETHHKLALQSSAMNQDTKRILALDKVQNFKQINKEESVHAELYLTSKENSMKLQVKQ